MTRLLGVALAAALVLIPSTVGAAKPLPPAGTIAIAAGSDPSYQGVVMFDVSTDGITGTRYPLVYVACSQDGSLVYGQLDHPDAAFLLGGGWSDWVEVGGGAADCTASLLVYGGKVKGRDVITFLASVDFHAAA
jgi:hypothetical protein